MLKEKIFYAKDSQKKYLKYYYHNTDNNTKKPLLIYIHGSGSRGEKLSDMSRVGPLGELDKGRDIPAVLAAPQCHKNTWFDLFSVLEEFIEPMIATENIDKQRVYLCGISMGAYASWQMAMSHPEWFAALVAVCGGGMYWNAARLRELPIWAFHGARDKTVLPEESIHMVDAVNANGGNAKITIYPNTQHDSWVQAYSDDSMWEWLFQQQKEERKKL